METTIHWIEKRQTERVFSDKFVVTYLAPWDVSDILAPPRLFATSPPSFCLVQSFSVDPHHISNEHAPTNQETIASPCNEPHGNSGLEIFIQESKEKVPAYTIFPMCDLKPISLIISYPSLGLVCIEHP